jgi:hypothetical protein
MSAAQHGEAPKKSKAAGKAPKKSKGRRRAPYERKSKDEGAAAATVPAWQCADAKCNCKSADARVVDDWRIDYRMGTILDGPDMPMRLHGKPLWAPESVARGETFKSSPISSYTLRDGKCVESNKPDGVDLRELHFVTTWSHSVYYVTTRL